MFQLIALLVLIVVTIIRIILNGCIIDNIQPKLITGGNMSSKEYSSEGMKYDQFVKYINPIIDELSFPVKKTFYTDKDIQNMYKNLVEYTPTVLKMDTPQYTMVEWKHYGSKSPYMVTVGMIEDSGNNTYENINILPDMFNELPRVKSVGFGEKYSPYDHWTKKELRGRWLPHLYQRSQNNNNKFTLHDMREALIGYLGDGTVAKDRIIEARQGKCTITKGAYLFCTKPADYIMNQENAKRLRILDVPSAYGDRMITAMSCKVDYYLGIDPYMDLAKGYEEIIEKFAPSNRYKYIIAPLEKSLIPVHDFNMCIMSPPPHSTETYGYDEKSKKGQSSEMYPHWDDWIVNFMFASIIKVYEHMSTGGSFYLTILDRLKGNKIIYTELVLLFCSAIGFDYKHIVYWEGGRKGMGTPFWVFKKDKVKDKSYVHAIAKTYNKEFNMMQNVLKLKNQLFSTKDIHFTEGEYDILATNPVYKQETIVTEIIRYMIVNEIFRMLHSVLLKKNPDIKISKVKTYIGRWMMVQSLNSRNSVDPLFPAYGDLHDQLKENIDAEDLFTTEYILSDMKAKGITSLFNKAIILLEIISNRCYNISCNIRKKDMGDTIELYPQINFELLDKEMLGIPLTNIKGICTLGKGQYELMKKKHRLSKKQNVIDNDIYKCVLRYASLGDKAHQYTREESRFEAYKKEYNTDFELFGAPFNVHASYHMSLFHDTDAPFGSVGSYFNTQINKGNFITNPVNDFTFVARVVDKVLESLDREGTKLKYILGLVVWEDDDGELREQEDKKIWYITSGKNDNVRKCLTSKYLTEFKLADTSQFKTLDPISGKVLESKGNDRIPLVIVLSNY